MGRFYRTSAANPVDYMYRVNAPLMQSVVEANDKYIDAYRAGAEKLDQLGHEFQYAPQDTQAAQQVMQGYGQRADAITSTLQSDPANWRSNRGALDSLTKDLYSDYTTGAISAYSGNAARRKEAFDAADAQAKLWNESGGTKGQDPTVVDAFKEHWDKGFTGTNYNPNKPNIYNVYQGGAVPNYIDVEKAIEDGMDKIKSQKDKEYFETDEGAFWRDKHTNIVEQITPEKVLSVGMGNIGPKVMNYLQQLSEVGIVDPKSLTGNPYSVSSVTMTPDEQKKVADLTDQANKVKDKKTRDIMNQQIQAAVANMNARTKLDWNKDNYFAPILQNAISKYAGVTDNEHMVERTVDAAKTMLYEQGQMNARQHNELVQSEAHFQATNQLAKDKFIYDQKKDKEADALKIWEWNHPHAQNKTGNSLSDLLNIGADGTLQSPTTTPSQLTGSTNAGSTAVPVTGSVGTSVQPDYQIYRDTATGEIKPLLDAKGNMIPVAPVGGGGGGGAGGVTTPTPTPAITTTTPTVTQQGDKKNSILLMGTPSKLKYPAVTGKSDVTMRDFNGVLTKDKDGTDVKLYSNKGLDADIDRYTTQSKDLAIKIADLTTKLKDRSESSSWDVYNSQLNKSIVDKMEVDRKLADRKNYSKASEKAVMLDSPKAGNEVISEDEKKLYNEFKYSRNDKDGVKYQNTIQDLAKSFPATPRTVTYDDGTGKLRSSTIMEDSPQVRNAKNRLKQYLDVKDRVYAKQDNWLQAVRTDAVDHNAIELSGNDSKDASKTIVDNATGDMQFYTEDGTEVTGQQLDASMLGDFHIAGNKNHSLTFAAGDLPDFMKEHGISMNVSKVADTDRFGNGNAVAEVVFTDNATGNVMQLGNDKAGEGKYYVTLNNTIQNKLGSKFLTNPNVTDIASDMIDKQRKDIRQQLLRPNINANLGPKEGVKEGEYHYPINLPLEGSIVTLDVMKKVESDGEQSFYITKRLDGNDVPIPRLIAKEVNGKTIIVKDPDITHWGHYSDADDLNRQLKLDKIRMQLASYKLQTGKE